MDKYVSVIAWTLTAVFAMVVLLSSYDANALTLKKGEVLTSNGTVAAANETANGKAALAKDGYLVSAGYVFLAVGENTVKVPLTDLRGKSKAEIREIIGDAATEQLADFSAAVEGTIAELNAEGINAVNAIGMTTDELINSIDHDATIGAVVGATEEQLAALDNFYAEYDGQDVVPPSEADLACGCPTR